MSDLDLLPRRAFFFICIIGLFSYFSYNLIRTPLLPLFARDLGAAPAFIGMVVAASTLTGVFVKLPAGIVADMVGRRTILLAGVLVFSLLPFVYIWVHQVWELVAVRFIHGFATALFAPVSMAVVAELHPEKRGEYLGWYFSSTQAGKLLGPMAGGFLLGYAGFTQTFILCGLLGILPLALMLRMPGGNHLLRPPSRRAVFPDYPPVDRSGHGRVVRQMGRFLQEIKQVGADRKVLVVSAMEAVQMLAAGALMAFLPIYGLDVGLTAAQVGLLFGIQGSAALVSKPLMGRLSDRVGRRPLVVLGLLISASTFAMIPAVTGFGALFFLAAGFGLGEAIVISSTSAFVADLWRERSLGPAMGAYGTIMDIGHASGPILAGVLITALGYLTAFRTISLILLIGLAVFLMMIRSEARAE